MRADLIRTLPEWATHADYQFNLMQHSDGYDVVHYVGRRMDPLCSGRHEGYDYAVVKAEVDCYQCLRILGAPAHLASLIKQLCLELTLLEHSNETLRYALSIRGGGRGT